MVVKQNDPVYSSAKTTSKDNTDGRTGPAPDLPDHHRNIAGMGGGAQLVGAFCSHSRHDGLNAGEAGADYVAFGPVAETSLGDGQHAEKELFSWWSEMIEVPVVAEGALNLTRMRDLADVTDFFAIGPEIWSSDTPLKTLHNLVAAMTA